MSVLEEAYERLHRTGPEFGADSWLSNHGPMAVEVLVRRGYEAAVPSWMDWYVQRLEDLPRVSAVLTDQNWPDALGDHRRIGDWTDYLTRQVDERPWRDVLLTWWPRLLPGIVAGATHGVIRVGHAVHHLLAGDESQPAGTELAHGLAYWAARAQPIPATAMPAGNLDPAAALRLIPHIAEQRGTVAARLAQLADLDGWTGSLAALRAPTDPHDARARLSDLVTAATLRYLTHGHGSSVLLIHAATAPNAVLRTLPALPSTLWPASLAAAWAASAAITSAFAPLQPAPRTDLPVAPIGADAAAETIDRATAHRDEHVIKFADTAVDVFGRTANPDALAAAIRASQLIGPP